MNKYPLIGVSICAVVLLVLSLLSNVVGYQSVKSTAGNDSPLFQIRTQKATNQQQNILTSQYLGRGIKSNLQFPFRENRSQTLQQFVERIKAMDKTEFGRFQSLIVSYLSKDKNNKNINSIQILSILSQLRADKKLPINYFANIKNKMDPCTIASAGHCPSTTEGFFICLEYAIVMLIFYFLMSLFDTSGILCWTLYCSK